MAKYQGITKRLGSRYGVTVRKRLQNVEAMYKGKHTCPYCMYTKVKRVAAGIWQCGKCTKKFTGKAYELAKSKQSQVKTDELSQFQKVIGKRRAKKAKEAEEKEQIRAEQPKVVVSDVSEENEDDQLETQEEEQ